MKRPMTGLN
ncbi:hypothetical protein ZEAMMB73_Zm00001d000019, partial [Zea mays]